MDGDLLTNSLAFTVASIISVAVICVASTRTEHTAPLWVGYVLRLAVGLGVYFAIGLYVPDARGYDRQAMEFVNFHWPNGDGIETSLGKEGFTLVLATVYAILGHLTSAGIILNATAGALVTPLLASAAERLGAQGRYAAWIVALFPPIIFWGSLLLREALVWLSLAVIAWALTGMAHRTTLRDSLWMISGLTCLLWVRGTAAILVGAGGLLALMFVRRKAGGVALTLSLLGLILVSPLADRALDVTEAYDLDEINRSRAALTREADSGFPTASYQGPAGIIRALPSMLPRVLAGPFPWEWPGMHPLFAMDTLVWVLLLFWAWRGRKVIGNRLSLSLVVPALVIALALAVTSGNYGTMQRLRLLSVVLLVPVAAAGVRPNPEQSSLEAHEPAHGRAREPSSRIG